MENLKWKKRLWLRASSGSANNNEARICNEQTLLNSPESFCSLGDEDERPSRKRIMTDSDDEEWAYNVKAILDKRIINRKVEYLVKWLQCDEEEEGKTWELYEELVKNIHCKKLIVEFNENRRGIQFRKEKRTKSKKRGRNSIPDSADEGNKYVEQDDNFASDNNTTTKVPIAVIGDHSSPPDSSLCSLNSLSTSGDGSCEGSQDPATDNSLANSPLTPETQSCSPSVVPKRIKVGFYQTMQVLNGASPSHAKSPSCGSSETGPNSPNDHALQNEPVRVTTPSLLEQRDLFHLNHSPSSIVTPINAVRPTGSPMHLKNHIYTPQPQPLPGYGVSNAADYSLSDAMLSDSKTSVPAVIGVSKQSNAAIPVNMETTADMESSLVSEGSLKEGYSYPPQLPSSTPSSAVPTERTSCSHKASSSSAPTPTSSSRTSNSQDHMMDYANNPAAAAAYSSQPGVFYPQATPAYRPQQTQQQHQTTQNHQQQQQQQPQAPPQQQSQQEPQQQQQPNRPTPSGGQQVFGTGGGPLNSFDPNSHSFMWNSRPEQVSAGHPSSVAPSPNAYGRPPSGSNPFPSSLSYEHHHHMSGSLLFSGLNPLAGYASMFGPSPLSAWAPPLGLEANATPAPISSRSQPQQQQQQQQQPPPATTAASTTTSKATTTRKKNAAARAEAAAPKAKAAAADDAAVPVLPHQGSSAHHYQYAAAAAAASGNHHFTPGAGVTAAGLGGMAPAFGDYHHPPHHPLAEHAQSSALYQQLLQRQQEELMLRNPHHPGLLVSPAAYPLSFSSGLGLQPGWPW